MSDSIWYKNVYGTNVPYSAEYGTFVPYSDRIWYTFQPNMVHTLYHIRLELVFLCSSKRFWYTLKKLIKMKIATYMVHLYFLNENSLLVCIFVKPKYQPNIGSDISTRYHHHHHVFNTGYVISWPSANLTTLYLDVAGCVRRQYWQ